jgi:transcriptional regulator with XRE-family HTH domain
VDGLEASPRMATASAPRKSDLPALGAAIRQLRAMKAMSQEQLSLEAGLHRNYVGRVERSELSPTFEPLVSIARALDVGPDELMRLYVLELR